MNRKLYYEIDVLTMISYLVLFANLLLCLLQMDPHHAIGYSALLALPGYCFICFVLNKYVNHLFLHVLGLSIGLLLAKVCSYSFASAWLILGILVILELCALVGRKQVHGFTFVPLTAESFVFYLIPVFFAFKYKHPFLMQIAIASVIVHLVIFFILVYLQNLYQYILQNKETQSQSIKSLYRSNLVVLGLYLMIFLLLIIASYVFPISELLMGGLHLIEAIIKWPIRLIMFLLSGEGLAPTANLQLQNITLEKMAQSQRILAIWKVLEWILKVVIYYMACRLLLRLFLFFIKYFGTRYHQNTDVITYIESRNRSREHIPTRHRKRRPRNVFGNTTWMVRQLLIKLVETHPDTKAHLKKGATVEQICTSMNVEEVRAGIEPKNYTNVITLYEKARYSNDVIHREELRQVKDELKKNSIKIDEK